MTEPLRRVALRIAADEHEQTVARLLGLAPDGFEEQDRDGGIELAVYTDAAGEKLIRGAFPGATSEAVEPCWENAWRAFHRPVSAGGIWIGPPWETPPPGPSVVIDPGRAFGTGAHPTTRLCVELLAGAPRGSLVDVGCGSGVLAIAAARLGFGPLLAVDNDPVAVDTTRANAQVNGVELEARVLDALNEPIPAADLAVANVLLAPVETVLGRLESRVAITSGYLEGQVPAHGGWERTATVTLGDWAADRFDRR